LEHFDITKIFPSSLAWECQFPDWWYYENSFDGENQQIEVGGDTWILLLKKQKFVNHAYDVILRNDGFEWAQIVRREFKFIFIMVQTESKNQQLSFDTFPELLEFVAQLSKNPAPIV
jgi:hypothetical protein